MASHNLLAAPGEGGALAYRMPSPDPPEVLDGITQWKGLPIHEETTFVLGKSGTSPVLPSRLTWTFDISSVGGLFT